METLREGLILIYSSTQLVYIPFLSDISELRVIISAMVPTAIHLIGAVEVLISEGTPYENEGMTRAFPWRL